ncbi:hypothetical protein ACIP5Y_31025 [Nocardia sp. NPDC088792]|uniref:hypothetical protein n=1 Tax=Nocardia sp. NPDC088792 TaxID=3364332 RepID=UPI00382E4699
MSALKVANDIDFLKPATIAEPKSAGGMPAITPATTMRPFGSSRSRKDGRSAPATMSMMTS